ncbi:hypothetical protein COB64_01335 [Candidatus Wolfebacteria bacterium]|nr:MAG: hypothetical protein COB64_01335 [Candidatus Wolfebacteria bacterium]
MMKPKYDNKRKEAAFAQGLFVGLFLAMIFLLLFLFTGGELSIERTTFFSEATETTENIEEAVGEKVNEKSTFEIFEERIDSFMPDKVPNGSDIFQLASKLDVLVGQKYGYKLDVSEDGKLSGWERLKVSIGAIELHIYKYRIEGLSTSFILGSTSKCNTW